MKRILMYWSWFHHTKSFCTNWSSNLSYFLNWEVCHVRSKQKNSTSSTWSHCLYPRKWRGWQNDKIKLMEQKRMPICSKQKQKTSNWIFVFKSGGGWNDNIKREAENLYNDLGNVNVLALDMYDGKLATTRDDAGKYMRVLNKIRVQFNCERLLSRTLAECKNRNIGWCFGGHSINAGCINSR